MRSSRQEPDCLCRRVAPTDTPPKSGDRKARSARALWFTPAMRPLDRMYIDRVLLGSRHTRPGTHRSRPRIRPRSSHARASPFPLAGSGAGLHQQHRRAGAGSVPAKAGAHRGALCPWWGLGHPGARTEHQACREHGPVLHCGKPAGCRRHIGRRGSGQVSARWLHPAAVGRRGFDDRAAPVPQARLHHRTAGTGGQRCRLCPYFDCLAQQHTQVVC